MNTNTAFNDPAVAPSYVATLEKATELLGRVLLSVFFVVSGWGKISGFAGTAAYMEAAGVPGALLPLVIILELFGGAAIVVGWQTRIVAALLAGFTLLSGIIFHTDFADPVQSIMFLKNLAIAGGFLLLVARGAGPFSLDRLPRRLTRATRQ
jgi:putative oxidoreductase